jgi:LmbE family N-acetylglucosaminyl deacetylase
VDASVVEYSDYNGEMHTDHRVASELVTLLRGAEPQKEVSAEFTASTMEHYLSELVRAAEENRIMFGNGKYFVYFKHDGTVMYFDYIHAWSGTVTVSQLSQLGSWQYMQSYGDLRINQETRKWIMAYEGNEIRKIVYRIAS